MLDTGIEVTVASGLPGFIRRAELSRDRADQRPDRFAPGDRFDARVTSVDKRDRKLGLSVKAQEVAEEKQAMAEYGSSDSGASLGDILGAAIRERAQREATTGTEEEDTTEAAAPADEDEGDAAAGEGRRSRASAGEEEGGEGKDA